MKTYQCKKPMAPESTVVSPADHSPSPGHGALDCQMLDSIGRVLFILVYMWVIA